MTSSYQAMLQQIAQQARQASFYLATASSEDKNRVLLLLAELLLEYAKPLESANLKDCESALSAGISNAMLDRLKLNPSRIQAMAEGCRQVASLKDPVGEILREWTNSAQLKFQKRRVPIGVIAMIYESRPNATIEASILCLKSGNASILRGGSEAIHTNTLLVDLIQKACTQAGFPAQCVQLIEQTDREIVPLLCRMKGMIDLIIPRGGKALIETVTENARVPVLKHAEGVCHVYVHAEANLEMAQEIILNAKCQRPSVCNAVETVLIDEVLLDSFAPKLTAVLEKQGVEIFADEFVSKVCGRDFPQPERWDKEYLDFKIALRAVEGSDQALEHIARFGSKHSDAIVTENALIAEKFLNSVDSAVVYWNASTRFTDGFEFGMGAEIGISTDKLHARGPMGLEELTTYKYCVVGQGHIRPD
jgi:glutamate-5-semialdehyde dehydrogenase